MTLCVTSIEDIGPAPPRPGRRGYPSSAGGSQGATRSRRIGARAQRPGADPFAIPDLPDCLRRVFDVPVFLLTPQRKQAREALAAAAARINRLESSPARRSAGDPRPRPDDASRVAAGGAATTSTSQGDFVSTDLGRAAIDRATKPPHRPS